jgi:hypothetical protein
LDSAKTRENIELRRSLKTLNLSLNDMIENIKEHNLKKNKKLRMSFQPEDVMRVKSKELAN